MPKFTRHHYEATADVLAAVVPLPSDSPQRQNQHALTVLAFVAAFTLDNPRFDTERFIKAAKSGRCVTCFCDESLTATAAEAVDTYVGRSSSVPPTAWGIR